MMSLLRLFSCILFLAVSFSVDYIHGYDEKLTFNPPSLRFLKHHPIKKISVTLKTRGVPFDLKQFYEKVIRNERPGFIGYHATRSEFRIYQDIIRFAIEEIAQIPIRKNFHFMRVPGDADLKYSSAKHFLSKHPVVNDAIPEQAKHLVSMNMALYANYDEKILSSCTIRLFSQNTSSVHLGNYESRIEPLFTMLGIDKKHIKPIFEHARQELVMPVGVLLQFFDYSHVHSHNQEDYYKLADHSIYVSRAWGKPYGTEKVSSYYKKGHGPKFPELRLVASNTTTLNPMSDLVIIRYDLLPAPIKNKYESKMRELIRNLPANPKKVAEYRDTLMSYWKVQLPQQRVVSNTKFRFPNKKKRKKYLKRLNVI